MKAGYTLLSFLLTFLLFSTALNCQVGKSSSTESRYIVDMPTAGILSKGSFSSYTQVFTGGGVMTELTAAPFEDFSMGISFSGANVISSGDVVCQKYPGIQLRYRFVDETLSTPAFLIGINTQGRGAFDEKAERFQTLSPGAFIAVSKWFSWFLGDIGLNAGINYSFEPPSDSRSINGYLGIEQSIGKAFALTLEYNPTLDDGNKQFLTNNGLLNAGVRFSGIKGFSIELQIRDLLKNYADVSGFTRWLTFEYSAGF
jgi:hypothetical protein